MRTVGERFGRTAAIALAVLGLAVGCADESADVADDAAADPRLVDLVVAPAPAVLALENERLASVVEVGFTGLTDLDLGEARAQVDEALTDLKDAVDEAGDPATAYGSTLDALDQLGSVRASVDAQRGSIDIGDSQALRAVEAPFTEMTGAILDAAEATTLDIDDPRLRRGSELHTAGLGQLLLERELTEFILIVTIGNGGLFDSASVGEAARLDSEVRGGQATVMEMAAGSEYADIADQLRADLAVADLARVVQPALETGVVDIQALLSAAGTEPDVGWRGFLARLEEALRGQTGE